TVTFDVGNQTNLSRVCTLEVVPRTNFTTPDPNPDQDVNFGFSSAWLQSWNGVTQPVIGQSEIFYDGISTGPGTQAATVSGGPNDGFTYYSAGSVVFGADYAWKWSYHPDIHNGNSQFAKC